MRSRQGRRPPTGEKLLRLAAEAGITGGSIYDALVAATAKHAGASLLTRGRRARPAYDLVGAGPEIVD